MACLLAAVTTALSAQNITVKGVVSDASNGEPITGAAVEAAFENFEVNVAGGNR